MKNATIALGATVILSLLLLGCAQQPPAQPSAPAGGEQAGVPGPAGGELSTTAEDVDLDSALSELESLQAAAEEEEALDVTDEERDLDSALSDLNSLNGG